MPSIEQCRNARRFQSDCSCGMIPQRTGPRLARVLCSWLASSHMKLIQGNSRSVMEARCGIACRIFPEGQDPRGSRVPQASLDRRGCKVPLGRHLEQEPLGQQVRLEPREPLVLQVWPEAMVWRGQRDLRARLEPRGSPVPREPLALPVRQASLVRLELQD